MSALKKSLIEHKEKVIKQGRGVPIQTNTGWVISNSPEVKKEALERMTKNINNMN